MNNVGFLTAIGAALTWGSYMVPFKKSQSEKLILFQALMAVGILISGMVLSLLMGFPLQVNIYGIASGVLWGVANAISLVAVLNLGISRAIPVMSSLVILTSFLWGTFVFGELPSGMGLGFLGIGLIILGVILASATGNTQSQSIRKGLIMAVLAGLIFGSQFVPIKLANLVPKDYFLSMSLGVFLTGMTISVIKKVKLENIAVGESILSGVVWNIGNLLGAVTISLIGLAKGLPITQLSVLIAVLWGLFYFKEITQSKQRLQVLIGAVILLAGVITLSMA